MWPTRVRPPCDICGAPGCSCNTTIAQVPQRDEAARREPPGVGTAPPVPELGEPFTTGEYSRAKHGPRARRA